MVYNHNINPAAVHMIQHLVERGCTNFLEFGCWTGALGNFATQRFSVNWVGVEGDLTAISSRTHRFKTHHYDLNQGPLSLSPLIADCHAIVMVDVLEHLYEPIRFLEQIAQLLNPSRKLLVVLPNISCHQIVEKILDGSFAYEDSGILDRTHRYFWSPTSFLDDCTQLGLSPLAGPYYLKNQQGENLCLSTMALCGNTLINGHCYSLSIKLDQSRLDSFTSYGFGYILEPTCD